MHIVYVLFSEKLNKRYVGFTKDLSRKMAEHNAGKSVFTKSGLPWKIIYQESFVDKSDAMKREKFLKSGVGKKYLDEIISTR